MALDATKPVFLLPGDNYAASATITASEEAAGHDADNLKSPSYASTWRSTGVTADRRIDADLGAQKTDIQCIGLFGFNGTDGATVALYGDNTAGFVSPEHTTGDIAAWNVSRPVWVADAPPWGRALLYFPPSDWSARYVRVELTDTANPAGHLAGAYLFIGRIRQAAGLAPDWRLAHTFIGSVGRQVLVRSHQARLLLCTEDQRRSMVSLAGGLLQAGRFGFVPRPADDANWPAEAILGRLSSFEDMPLGWIAGGVRFDVTIGVREVTD